MGRRRVEELTDARREQMLRAAVEVIAERGYSETRISDVAKVTGASPALVIYYFKTKAGLLTEAMRYADDLFYDAVDKDLSTLRGAPAKLAYLVRASCSERIEVEQPHAWGLWLDLWAQALRDPALAKVRAQVDHRWVETIALVVAEGVDAGDFQPVDVDQFSMIFAAILDGLSIQVALQDELVTQDRAIAGALSYAQSVLKY